MALEAINAAMPETIGGSADLTGSNNTKTKAQKPLTSDDYGGRYIYYGIREFGMAAAMNGMALHGGVHPLWRHLPGLLRLLPPRDPPVGAAAGAKVIYVMTHDSIGLGEDGPTHQPVEHLLSLRAMPQARRLPPRRRGRDRRMLGAGAGADDGPSLLALTRQNLPPVRDRGVGENLLRARRLPAARGRGAAQGRSCIATGSEVEIALDVADALEAQGIGADVVSMPCCELFDAQDAAYREDLLPDVSNREILRVSIEAGTTLGWERYTGLHGLRIGIDRFGASAPADDLYDYFGLTAAQDHEPGARSHEG